MPIRPTAATLAIYDDSRSLRQNLAAGVRFEWFGGRGGEVGIVQGAYMDLVKSADLRWIANFPFTTDAEREPASTHPSTMRAHHVPDAAIKRKVVDWVNAGMSSAVYLETLEDLSSINSLTCPDIIFPEKVAAVWVQWLSGWMKAASAFKSAVRGAPCPVSLQVAERLVANMSTALANFRPGFGITDADGVAHAICPREATCPSLNLFNRALMSLNINCGNIALESFWVSSRYSPTIAAIPSSSRLPQHLVMGGFRGDGTGRIYSSERKPGMGTAYATIHPGAGVVIPNAHQILNVRKAIKVRNGVVTVGAAGVTYLILLYLLLPLFRTIMQFF